MSQRPPESIIDRFIDWWKQLFGPPNAEGSGSAAPTRSDRVQGSESDQHDDGGITAGGVAGSSTATGASAVSAPADDTSTEPVDDSGDTDTAFAPSDIRSDDDADSAAGPVNPSAEVGTETRDDGGTAAAFDAAEAGRSAAAGTGQAAASAAQQLEHDAETLRQNRDELNHNPLYMEPGDDPDHTAVESEDERESSEWVENDDAVDATDASETTDSYARESPEQDDSNWGQGTIDQPGSHDQADDDREDTSSPDADTRHDKTVTDREETSSPDADTSDDNSIPSDTLDEDGFSSFNASPQADNEFEAGDVATAADFGTQQGDDESVVGANTDEKSWGAEPSTGTDDTVASTDDSALDHTAITDDDASQRDNSGDSWLRDEETDSVTQDVSVETAKGTAQAAFTGSTEEAGTLSTSGTPSDFSTNDSSAGDAGHTDDVVTAGDDASQRDNSGGSWLSEAETEAVTEDVSAAPAKDTATAASTTGIRNGSRTGGGVATPGTASSETAPTSGAGPSGLSSSGRKAPEGAVAGDGGNVCPAEFPIKGNGNSHIYHMPGESSYDATVAEWCFASEDTAKAAGFRARKR